MNNKEQLQKFEIKLRDISNNQFKYTISHMLGLPYLDTSYVISSLSYGVRKLSENYLLAGISFISNIENSKFDSVSNFKSLNERYGNSFKIEEIESYVNNLYEQWFNILKRADLGSDLKKFEDNKNLILDRVKNFSNNYKRMELFLEKYSFIEEEYVRNKNDKIMEPILKEELYEVIDEFKDINVPESIRIFGDKSVGYFVENLLKETQSLINDIRTEIYSKNPSLISTIADKYITSLESNENNVTSFLKYKNFEENIDAQIKLTKSQKIEHMISFKDNSFAVKERGKPFRTAGHLEIVDLVEDLTESMIDYMLRKKPKMAEYFKEMYLEDSCPSEYVFLPIETYLKNEQILKNMNFDFSAFSCKGFEELDDGMNAAVHNYKIIKFANSILSNKYKHLLTDESIKSFKEIYEGKYTELQLQELVGKKLAALKTPEEFTDFMVKVSNQLSGFNEDNLFAKLSNLSIKPLISENGVYVFEVTTFEQSKLVGSPSWCISRSESYFNNYTSEGAKQFFIYDFNKKESDNNSMIGITIKNDGTFSTQHLKNDDYIYPDDFLENIKKSLILKELDKYNLCERLLKEYGVKSELKNNLESLDNKKMKVGL